jgi:hypothetical protein
LRTNATKDDVLLVGESISVEVLIGIKARFWAALIFSKEFTCKIRQHWHSSMLRKSSGVCFRQRLAGKPLAA